MIKPREFTATRKGTFLLSTIHLKWHDASSWSRNFNIQTKKSFSDWSIWRKTIVASNVQCKTTSRTNTLSTKCLKIRCSPITVARETHHVVAIRKSNLGIPLHADTTLNLTLYIKLWHVTTFLVAFFIPLLAFGLLLKVFHPSHPSLQLL